MNKKNKNSCFKNPKGFSLLEITLGLFLLGTFIIIFLGMILYGNQTLVSSEKRERALFLAEEGIEATRNLRDQNFSLISDGSHGLSLSGNKWQFSGTSDVTEDFTRTIQISSIDSTTKEITSTVSWPKTMNRGGSVTLKSYLTNWHLLTRAIGNWSGSGENGPFVQSQVDAYGVSPWGLRIKVKGNYVYITVNLGFTNFIVINVTDPANPIIADELSLPWIPVDVAVTDTRAFVANTEQTQEIQEVDVTDQANTKLLRVYDDPNNSGGKAIEVVGNIIYLVEYFGDLSLVDATTLTQLSTINLSSECNDIVIIGNYAYIASDSNSQEIKIVDISNPRNPKIVGYYDANGNWDGATITGFGNRLFLGQDSGAVLMLDISNPIVPRLLQGINVGNDVRDFSLGNNNTYLFLATKHRTAEVQIVQITGDAMTVIGTVDLSHDVMNGAQSGISYSNELDRLFSVGENWQNEFNVISPR